MEIKLYKGKVKINFAEKDWNGKKIHKYTDSKGNKIESVTGITGLLDKSTPLMIWATRMMGDYILDYYSGQVITPDIIETAKKQWREAKEKAADIGSAIHEWVEQKIKGLEPEIPQEEKVRNGAIAFLKWMKTHDIKFKETERIVYSKKYNYVGRCDWFGKEGKTWIIGDHKSSKGIYNEMRYQLAAYWNASEEERIAEFEKGIIVKYGKEDGEFETLEISRREYLKDREAFLGLLQTKRREIELKKD